MIIYQLDANLIWQFLTHSFPGAQSGDFDLLGLVSKAVEVYQKLNTEED